MSKFQLRTTQFTLDFLENFFEFICFYVLDPFQIRIMDVQRLEVEVGLKFSEQYDIVFEDIVGDHEFFMIFEDVSAIHDLFDIVSKKRDLIDFFL